MDQLVGVAILIPADENDPKDCGYLHYVAQRSSGGCFVEWIPVISEAKWHEGHRAWAYRIEGDTIHGHPSINDQGYLWHNAFNWSTKFVIYASELLEKYRTNSISDLVKELNPTFFPR